MSRIAQLFFGLVVALAIPSSIALALGFRLGESKDELDLKYEVSVYDHDTGRVTVKFTLEDEGRLAPVTSIDLHIPSTERHDSGGFKSDLTISMATTKEGTKQVGRVHLRKDWAARAEIHLKTAHLDGKQEALTWYYHAIPLKDPAGSGEATRNCEVDMSMIFRTPQQNRAMHLSRQNGLSQLESLPSRPGACIHEED